MEQVFTATYLAWIGLELWVIVRDRRRGAGSADRRSTGVALAFLVLAVITGLQLSDLSLLQVHIGADSRLLAGTLTMWLGLALRCWAIYSLGRYFTAVLRTEEHQPIVQSGPYKQIRHPSYAGALLSFAGLGLALGNWIGLAAMVALSFTGYVLRMDAEERVLLAAFGQRYRDYMRHTKRIIPFVY